VTKADLLRFPFRNIDRDLKAAPGCAKEQGSERTSGKDSPAHCVQLPFQKRKGLILLGRTSVIGTGGIWLRKKEWPSGIALAIPSVSQQTDATKPYVKIRESQMG